MKPEISTEERVKMRAAIEILSIFNVPTDIQQEVFELMLDVFVMRMRTCLDTKKDEAATEKNSAPAEPVQVPENQEVIDPEYVRDAELDLTPNKDTK